MELGCVFGEGHVAHVVHGFEAPVTSDQGRELDGTCLLGLGIDGLDRWSAGSGSRPGLIYSSMAPPIRRRCRLKVYDGSAARRAR